MPPTLQSALIDELRLIGPEELAVLLHRSVKYIKKDASQRPEALPPRFRPPGSRKVLWRVKDVREWMDAQTVRSQAKPSSKP